MRVAQPVWHGFPRLGRGWAVSRPVPAPCEHGGRSSRRAHRPRRAVPADARSVLDWARKFRQGVREVGALVNMGLYEEAGPRRQGSDNYEMHMLCGPRPARPIRAARQGPSLTARSPRARRMNFVLPVAVTAGLGRALLRGRRARVVNVVTPAYKTDGVMWDDLQLEQGAYSPLAAVSQSQTALLTHAFVMQEVFASGSVTVGAVDPGRLVGAVLDVKGEESVLVDDAVELVVWAATDGAAALPRGKLVDVAHEAREPEDVDCVELEPARKLYHDTCHALGLPADPAADANEGEDDSLFAALMCCGGAR